MIDQIKCKTFLICDSCGESQEFDNFNEAVEYKNDFGWKSIRIYKNGNNIWLEYCKNCKGGK
jgi:Fe2+ or Zn2+ uptake regulation protein